MFPYNFEYDIFMIKNVGRTAAMSLSTQINLHAPSIFISRKRHFIFRIIFLLSKFERVQLTLRYMYISEFLNNIRGAAVKSIGVPRRWALIVEKF